MAVTKRLPSSERRKQIVKAGLELCRAAGIASLRTEKIARKIGVTPGALFRHYPTKSAILHDMSRSLLARLRDSVPADSSDPREWIEEFVRGRVRLLREDEEVRLLFSDGFIAALPEEAQAEVHDAFKKSWVTLNEKVRQIQSAGEARADLATHELAAAVVGLIQAVLHPPLADLPEWSSPETVWATARDLLGIRQPALKGGR